MARVAIELSGVKAGDVRKIGIFTKDRSRELVAVEVKNGKPVAAEGIEINETEIYIVVIYKGLAENLTHRHYLDVRIIGDGTLVIAADGQGNSRVNFRS